MISRASRQRRARRPLFNPKMVQATAPIPDRVEHFLGLRREVCFDPDDREVVAAFQEKCAARSRAR
ncbi:MAG: hypothetical protein AAFX81_12800 [Pseudomonadota bacterium]